VLGSEQTIGADIMTKMRMMVLTAPK
jgi:hypothetical protein